MNKLQDFKIWSTMQYRHSSVVPWCKVQMYIHFSIAELTVNKQGYNYTDKSPLILFSCDIGSIQKYGSFVINCYKAWLVAQSFETIST